MNDTLDHDIISPPPPKPAILQEPDWSTRPWGRPTIIDAVPAENAPNLVAFVEFTLAGVMRVRGIRVYANDDGTFYIAMPRKSAGETRSDIVFFPNWETRQQFFADVAWAIRNRARRNGGRR